MPTVHVRFRIADHRFQRELGSRTPDAEKVFLPIVVRELEQRIGFLRFSADAAPAGEQRYQLLISLGDTAASTGDVRFNIGLSSPSGFAAGKDVFFPFRPIDRALEPLSPKQSVDEKIHDVNLVGAAGLPGELARKFGAGDYTRLVTELLSKVPISADGAQVMAGQDPTWVLPLHRGETCMDLLSRFRVAHLLNGSEELPMVVEATGPADAAADALIAPIIARVPDSPDQSRSLLRLSSAGASVKIESFFITQYLRRPVCAGASLPTDAISGGGQ